MHVSRAAFLDHFEYTRWASLKLIDACGRLTEAELTRDLQVSHRGVLQTMQHIYYADRTWLARLEGRTLPSFQDPDPGPSLEDLKTVWADVHAALIEFVARAPEELFESELRFQRLDGSAHRMEHWKVLLHIVNHATLHRGQVMAMLRQLGHVPPATDYLYFQLQRQ